MKYLLTGLTVLVVFLIIGLFVNYKEGQDRKQVISQTKQALRYYALKDPRVCDYMTEKFQKNLAVTFQLAYVDFDPKKSDYCRKIFTQYSSGSPIIAQAKDPIQKIFGNPDKWSWKTEDSQIQITLNYFGLHGKATLVKQDGKWKIDSYKNLRQNQSSI